MHIDWGTILLCAVTLLGFFLANRREVKSRHKENVEAWGRLQYDLENFSLHQHVERDGPLSASGLRYPARRKTDV